MTPKITLLLLLTPWALSAEPPDASAWKEPRAYHESFDESYRARIRIERAPSVKTIPPSNAVLSKTQSAWLATPSPDASGKTAGLLVSTNASSFRITFQDTYPNFPVEARWTNEKLVFIRVWWGRVVGSDFIFDAESGRFIYEEMIHDGTILFQQTQQAKASTAGTLSTKKD